MLCALCAVVLRQAHIALAYPVVLFPGLRALDSFASRVCGGQGGTDAAAALGVVGTALRRRLG